MSAVKIKVDEVIGEHREDGILYYFARYDGGIAYKVHLSYPYVRPNPISRVIKFPSASFSQKFEALVKKYGTRENHNHLSTANPSTIEHKKSKGSLRPFHPSAKYVHPLSRPKVNHKVSKPRADASVGNFRDDDESNDGEEDDDEEDDGDYDGSDTAPARTSARLKKVLPFSPQKTRLRRVLIIDSDQEPTDSDGTGGHPPPRRSTRPRKGVKVNLDQDSYSDKSSSDDYQSGSIFGPKSKRVKQNKKIVHPKASRPAYGHFRGVAELDYDSFDDDDTVIREHRDICEKCHRGPTHKLIDKLRKSSKTKGKRRKKTTDDEFEESGDEEEKLAALGGWVRWYWPILYYICGFR